MVAGFSGRPQQRLLSLVTLYSHDILQFICFPLSANQQWFPQYHETPET